MFESSVLARDLFRDPQLAGLLDDQNHARAKDANVVVVAFEGVDAGLVVRGDGVESFTTFYSVANDRGFGRCGIRAAFGGLGA